MITYLKGDALRPVSSSRVLIPHVCNNIGAWGSGFVVNISKLWPQPEQCYREAYKSGNCKLGDIQVVPVNHPQICIVNMIAMDGLISKTNKKPLSDDALRKCMSAVAEIPALLGGQVEIHSPKFGACRGGGDWSIIEEMINELWKDIPVFIYEYDGPNG